MQLHKSPEGGSVVYSRTGVTFTSRFPSIASALNTLSAKSAIIDGELVAHNAKGMPAFYALHLRRAPPEHLAVWAFDLLELDGHDLRHLALATRRARLERLIAKADHPSLLLSETFSDPIKLLEACNEHGLEGIVSKRIDRP